MTINIFNRVKKSTDFETEVLQRLDCVLERFDCIQKSQATLRQDLREIVRQEIKNVLNERNKKGWWQIA